MIVKVHGHGSFRKRIIEMGFVRGKLVKVVLNAPLKDPIEYEIIGYKLSLRREEADKIEVISETEAKEALASQEPVPPIEADDCEDAASGEVASGKAAVRKSAAGNGDDRKGGPCRQSQLRKDIPFQHRLGQP